MKWINLLLNMTFCTGALFAQNGAAIHGSLRFPPDPPATAAYSRYQLPSAPMAKPPGPVAVVYVDGDFASPRGTNEAAAQITQKQFQFSPRVLPIRRGTRVFFPNCDDDYHNVLSYSKAKEFDLGRYRKEEKPPSVVFEKPGVVELDCEIHSHMRATILVLESPFFTITDAEGRYRLSGLPPGRYTLKAWLNPKLTWSRPVELTEGAALRVDFSGP